MQTLEASVIAEKAARDKRLADMRERGEGRREAARVKAAAEQAKARERETASLERAVASASLDPTSGAA